MKQATVLTICAFLLIVLCVGLATAGEVKSAGVKGLWKNPATWIGNAVPTASDNVTIADGDTVLIDTIGVCANLTVGEGGTAPSRLRLDRVKSVDLTINGDFLVNTNGTFALNSNQMPTGGNLVHTIAITGNLTNLGPNFNLRTGSSGSTLSAGNISFIGPGNSIITMGIWDPVAKANNSLNSVTINKSGTGKVILNSNVFLSTGSSAASSSYTQLRLVNGLLFTGSYIIVPIWGSDSAVVSASNKSYVVGNLGRGMSNSSGTTRLFPVGDSLGYRPCMVRSTSGGNATGHYVKVSVTRANAASGSPTFSNGVDKVSGARYYQVTYAPNSNGPVSMAFDRFSPSYGSDDGVAAGNQNLRVAYSRNRTAWTGLGPIIVPYTTRLDSLPRIIVSDTLPIPSATLVPETLNVANYNLYFALSRATGTTENSLNFTPTSVDRQEIGVPSTYALDQNYPNPFNPSTNFTYRVGKEGFVSVKIYDVLGREVATLVNEVKQAGTYPVTWNAAGFGTGMYFCKMQTGSFTETKKMLMLK